MADNKRITGRYYEHAAAQYLDNRGYRIIAMNYTVRAGEIDIIALDGNCVVFVEVKYRKNTAFGYPEEAVNLRKCNKIRTAARSFLTVNKMTDSPVRFDIIAILGNTIKHIKDAF